MKTVRKFLIIAALVAAGLFASVITVPGAATASTSPNCFAKPYYNTAGPGLKNWRAYDPYCNGDMQPGKWWGPWRYTKSGAFIDAEHHNAKMY